MKRTERELCKDFPLRVSFFNVRPEYIQRLLNSGEFLERIVMGICIPFLEKREQYREHIPGCKKCRPVYDDFLKRMAEKLGLSEIEVDGDYLEIYTKS